MRVLMWFSLGYGIACALGAYLIPQGQLLTAAAVFCAGMLVMLLTGIRFRKARIAALVLFGCSAGLGWFCIYTQQYLGIAQKWNDVTREAELTAVGYSAQTDYGWSVDAFVSIEEKPYRVRVYLEGEEEIAPGDRVYGVFRFRYTQPRAWERTSRYQGKGIFLTARQEESVEIHGSDGMSWWCYGPVLARKTGAILEEAFPEDVQSFVKALLLGDSDGLSYEADMDLRISGIRHIVAVSGLHVAILCGLVEFMTGKRRFLTALIGIPVMALFAAMAGFTPSVTRACVMAGLIILARLFDREYDSLTALAFACLVMLTVNPLIIVNAGFQLSVASVCGILLFCKPLDGWLLRRRPKAVGKIWRWICQCSAVTLSAMVLTVPLSAVYFGTVSVIGVVTNLLTLWVVNLIFNGTVAVCAVSLLSAKLAGTLGWMVAWPVRYVLLVAGWLSRVPLAAVYTDSVYIGAWLVFCYVLLGMCVIRKKRRNGVTFCCACLGLCIALGCSWLGPLTDGCRVTMLDVGQGQCILLQSRGKTFLVDCGGDTGKNAADRAFRKLSSQGIRRLDGVILTHGDADHIGGIGYLLSRMKTDLIIVPAGMDPEILPDSDAETVWVDRELVLRCDECTIRIFPPAFLEKDNENGLCILFEAENCGILITGDRSARGERMLIKRHVLPDVDVLVAGHHGAKTSACRDLLESVRPETVLISVGAGNPYGQPHEELLDRLLDFGCSVYRTDQEGTILYRGR